MPGYLLTDKTLIGKPAYVQCPHCKAELRKYGARNHINYCKRPTPPTGPTGYYRGTCNTCGRNVMLDGYTDKLRALPRHNIPVSPWTGCKGDKMDYTLGDKI